MIKCERMQAPCYLSAGLVPSLTVLNALVGFLRIVMVARQLPILKIV
jgi:hypothetical protein